MAVDPIAASVVGYILFRRNGAEGHIDRIAVDEHQRRKGLARSLLQSAIAALRTNRAMTLVLEVDTTNKGAIALYESQGFKRTTVRIDYYKSGCDALLMELRL
uniref:N-acetyltransferase domain-containing protein n=1 Tax=Hyaloperonospora arabidopsidis (strain Emoy2) TaxID=559515 RepID=M4BRB7_HYAAE